MKIKTVILLPLLFFLFHCQSDQNNTSANHYKINLQLDPTSQFIRVNLSLALKKAFPMPEKLIFYLHKQFTLHDVSGRGLKSYAFDKDISSPESWIPEGRAVLIELDRESIGKKQVKLDFEYDGMISEWSAWSANVITEEWVELGLYLPWFPYNQNYGPHTFEIEVECSPEYSVRSYGQFNNINGKWNFSWMTPTTDIVLTASKTQKSIQEESNGKLIHVHYSVLQDTTVKKLTEDLIGIFKLFDTWFEGDKNGEVTLIESLRERGGGYARTGLISLAGLSDDTYKTRHETYIRYLAHEAGHIWWHMAPKHSWEDWMNEGFAEYSALMTVKELFGDESFNKRLEAKKSILVDKPPIWGFNRNDQSTPDKSEAIEAILYSKGPVLLHLLAQRIGSDKFNVLCKDMVGSNTSSTEQFLDLLSKNHGTELMNWFEDLLRSY